MSNSGDPAERAGQPAVRLGRMGDASAEPRRLLLPGGGAAASGAEGQYVSEGQMPLAWVMPSS